MFGGSSRGNLRISPFCRSRWLAVAQVTTCLRLSHASTVYIHRSAFSTFIFAVYCCVSACPLPSLFYPHRFFITYVCHRHLLLCRSSCSSPHLWNPTVECHAHKRLPFVHITDRLIHPTPSQPPLSLSSSKWSLFFGGVAAYTATPPNQPHRCILTDYFNNYNFSKLK
jgi:hypothetical protein